MSEKKTEESFGELPTLGNEETARAKMPAGEGPSWTALGLSEAETLKVAGEIVDNGRTDGARRWKAGDVILDRYVVEGELGQGGMGVVYACLDRVGGVRVAVKCLPPELSHNSVEMEEVRENFELVYKLNHPNIVAVKTLERDGRGEYFLVMDMAEGESLRKWLRRKWKEGGVPPSEALPILRQVAAALDYAHAEKVVHRDVKPGNVMIDGRGRVKVLDFGLAAQIRTSLSRASHTYRGTSGTGPYMAPEQWEGKQQDGAADEYALGVMAYEMLAGHLPFENSELALLKDAVLHGLADSVPGLSKDAMKALRRALAKRKEERFPDCGAFVGALEGKRAGGERGKALAGWLAALVLTAAAGSGAWMHVAAEQKARKEALQAAEMAAEKAAAEEAVRQEAELQAAEAARLAAEQKAREEAVRQAAEKAAAEEAARQEAERQAAEAARLAEEQKAREEAARQAEEKAAEEEAARLEAERVRAEQEEEIRQKNEALEETVYRLAPLAKTKEENAERMDYDRGQGFGEKLDEMKAKLGQGEAAMQGRNFEKAKAFFEASMAAADWCVENAPLREAAQSARQAAIGAKKSADGMDGARLALRNYNRASEKAAEGEKAFGSMRFKEATAAWNAAAKGYGAAETEARTEKVRQGLEIARGAERRSAWKEILAAAEGVLALEAGNGEAKQLKAKAETAIRAGKVKQGLEAARGARDRGAWKEVVASADGVLAMEAGNWEAKRLKEEAKKHFHPGVHLVATLNGKEVGATLREWISPFATGKTTPVDVEVWRGGDYGFAAEYTSGGKRYMGWTVVNSKDHGVTNAEIALREVTPLGTGSRAGETRTIALPGGAAMTMVWCPPGAFWMGSPEGEKERGSNETRHRVTLTKGFWMAKYEVTQKQWHSVMGGDCGVENGNLPCSVGAEDAQVFCRRVGGGMRLPTEAEWEYACRAGSSGAYAGTGSLDDMGWYWDNSAGTEKSDDIGLWDSNGLRRYDNHARKPVGQKLPNAWGLHDMHGNMWEVCSDWCPSRAGTFPPDYAVADSVTDPTGPESGDEHIQRGGSWRSDAHRCRAANRCYSPLREPGARNGGFRPVVGVELATKGSSGGTEGAERGKESLRKEQVAGGAGATKTLALPGGAAMEMVWCPPGSFKGGTTHSHPVTLTKGFWIARTEVTQKQWASVMGTTLAEQMEKAGTRGQGAEGDNYPMYYVSWDEAQEFCRKAGLQLPTEAQWEYACRAGTETPYGGNGILDDMGWFDGNSGSGPRSINSKYKFFGDIKPVGRKKPNAWGLYDMHGNVEEWCADWYGGPSMEGSDPTGPESGTERIQRGGSYIGGFYNSGGFGFGKPPDTRSSSLGFRPIMLQQEEPDATTLGENCEKPAEKISFTVPAQGLGVVSVPYLNPRREDGRFMFGETMIAAELPEGCSVQFWNAEKEEWAVGTKTSKGWSEAVFNHELATGEGFFVKNPREESINVTVSGLLPTNACLSCNYAGGGKWSSMANPYPIAVMFGDTELARQLPQGSAVKFWDADKQAWSGGVKTAEGWADAQANHVIGNGEGFMLKTESEGEWRVEKPYEGP